MTSQTIPRRSWIACCSIVVVAAAACAGAHAAKERARATRPPVHNAVRFDSAAHHMPVVPHHQVTPLVGELMA